jgi:hypothetical protein
MATLDSPSQLSISAEVEPTFRALRAILRPLDYQQWGTGGVTRILGHYRAIFATTAAVGTTASAVLAAARYGDTASFMVLLKLSLSSAVVSTANATTAAAIGPLNATVARGFTSQYSTNASTVSLTGNNQKQRTVMGASALGSLGSLVVASAAAGLTTATNTLDGSAFGSSPLYPNPGLATVAVGTNFSSNGVDFYKYDKNSAHPLVFAGNEGFIITAPAVASGGGLLWTPTFEMEWAEVATF